MKIIVLATMLLLTGSMLRGMDGWEPEFKIRGDKPGNLWVLGDTVNFRALPPTEAKRLTEYRKELAAGKAVDRAAMPSDWKTVTGTVSDYYGDKIAEHTVDAAAFFCSGWNWKPFEPGFYSVVFSVKTKSGNVLPLCESVSSGRGWTVKVPPLVIKRQVHDFAVLTPAPVKRGVGFGVCLRPGREEEAIRMIPVIGFEYIRLHWIAWNEIEKTKGVFDWAQMDKTMKLLRNLGIKHFVGNPWGTPKWASSRPDAPGKGIWNDYYAAYAPAKISDLTDFLKALIKRYPDITAWEPWNEPHLPGQSIFWRSSPEEYVELQKAAYATIKKLQPKSSVWLAGIGMRYLPFYRKIIELGVGNSFDVLPLHGRDVNPEPFNEINRLAGIKPKPWVIGEWHAILCKTASAVIPSEAQLAHNMMLDLLEAFRNKVDKVTVWSWNQGTEREFIEHFHRHGENKVSIGGMMRYSPCREPRLPLAVLSTFMNCFSGQIFFSGHYTFAAGGQQAALLESNDGNVLCFWQNGDKPEKPAPQLAALLENGGVRSWDGRNVKTDGSFQMLPLAIYLLKSPDIGIIAKWSKKDGGIVPEKEVVLSNDVYGYYRNGHLFDSQMEVTSDRQQFWHPLTRFVAISGQAGTTPVPQGRFKLAFSDTGLDLLVEIKDQKHVQSYPRQKIWDGDSLQFALDAVGKGRQNDRIMFNAALTDKGPLLLKHCAPLLLGDLPSRYTDPPAEVKYGRIVIDQQPGMLIYKIHISRDDLYPFTYQEGQPVRFSLLVNNNDDKGRAGYLEWSSGIGNSNNPAQYGTMTMDIGSWKISDQKDLVFSGGGKAELGPDIATVTIAKTGMKEKITTRTSVAVTPGVAYCLSFAARGNVNIRAFAGLIGSDGKAKRLPLISPRMLKASSWTDFEHTFIIPAGTEKIYVTIFSWKEQGFYEIKDFRLTTGNYSATAKK